MKHLLLIALLLASVKIRAQSYSKLDTLLTRQAYRLVQNFDRVGWRGVAAALRTKPRPIWSYIARGPADSQSPIQRCPVYCPLVGESFASVSLPALRRFNHHMYELGLERRKTDYERLSNELLLRATKVHKLAEALPVLLFAVDTAGRVKDVIVDKMRSKYDLTQRSRKIILHALQASRFRALEASYRFGQPRPFRERLVRLRVGRRLNVAGKTLFGWALYKREVRRGRCGELRYVRKLRLGKGIEKYVLD